MKGVRRIDMKTGWSSWQVVAMATVCIIIPLSVHAQWVQLNCPQNYDLAVTVSGPQVIVGTFGHGMVGSTDNGNTWHNLDTIPNDPYAFHLGSDGNQVFAGTGSGFYVSTNVGGSWNCVLRNQPAFSFLPLGDTIIAGVGYGIGRTTDGGASWSYDPWDPIVNIFAFATDGPTVFAGGSRGVFSSTDAGVSWHHVAFSPDTCIYGLVYVHGNLVASTRIASGFGPSGYFISTDHGSTWSDLVPGGAWLCGKDDVLFSLPDLDLSIDGGFAWRAFDQGLPPSGFTPYDLTANETYVFLATLDGVWRRPWTDIFTSVKGDPGQTSPEEFSLSQNYPNPFNPTTRIRFSLPHVETLHATSLRVYDLLGREVATLVDDERRPGTYEVTFNGSNLASGVYFYRLQAGTFSQTRRLLLLR